MDQPVNLNDETNIDNVVREQGGQFIDEGGVVFAPDLEEAALAGEGESQLIDADKSSVHALQVNMERSGADYVQAQKSFLTNSGAREIHSESSRLNQSGVLTLNADSVEMKQSSSVVAQAKEISLHQSRILVGAADKMDIHEDSQFGVLAAGDIDAQGDVRSFLMVAGNVKAGGNVVTTMNATTAGVAAAVFAAAIVLFSRLFGKK